MPDRVRGTSIRDRALAVLVAAALGCGPSAPSVAPCRLLPGDLVITEVFADAAGNDTGVEWFEIYNARTEPIDLDGLTITHSRPDGSRPNTHVVERAMIGPGQYITLGNAPPDQLPPYVDHGYGDDLGELFNSDGGKLALSCGGSEIDHAVYGGIREGHSRELTGAQPPDYTRNDDPAAWCQANESEFEAGSFGTPGAESDCVPIVAGQCNDGGMLRDAVAPGAGDLVITEVMPSPANAADATGEWFEAKVMSDVDLNGVALDRAGDRLGPDVLTSADCLRVRAGSTVVFARSRDPAANGGLPAAAIRGTFRFSLIAGAPGAPGDVAILAGTTVIDAVSWTRSFAGASLQLDPGRIDAIANDTESNFCAATAPYDAAPGARGSDLGTPGADNTPCATLPGPGTCDDGGAVRPIATPASGALVISEVLANPAAGPAGGTPNASDAQREWFEVTNVGATAFDLNELAVGRIGVAGAPVQSARCLSVSPGGYAVFARSSDPALNGMLPSVAATFRSGLVDSHGDLQIAAGATVLDAVQWSSVTSGVSRQLDPRHLSATDNDDPARLCAGQAPYGDGTNLGTPGAANTPCP